MTDAPSDAAALTSVVEAAFERVAAARMHGVPILNPSLRVAAVGMRPVEDGWLCALVTPWCINLMLLPASSTEAASLASGTKVKRHFPAGVFEFTAGWEDGLGPYQMCSLFSPVLEFENQEAALIAAEAALGAVFNAGLGAEKPSTGVSRRGLLFGGRETSTP